MCTVSLTRLWACRDVEAVIRRVDAVLNGQHQHLKDAYVASLAMTALYRIGV